MKREMEVQVWGQKRKWNGVCQTAYEMAMAIANTPDLHWKDEFKGRYLAKDLEIARAFAESFLLSSVACKGAGCVHIKPWKILPGTQIVTFSTPDYRVMNNPEFEGDDAYVAKWDTKTDESVKALDYNLIGALKTGPKWETVLV